MTSLVRSEVTLREVRRRSQAARMTLLVNALVVGPSACSSQSAQPPASGGPEGGVDASGILTEAGGVLDDGRIDSGSDDATDGAFDGEGGSVIVVPPPVCPVSSTWSTITRVTSIASSGFDRFGGIAPDELTVAWSTAAGAIFTAERTSTSAPFGTPVQLDPGTLLLANDRVALPDNLDLIVTLADRSSFVSFIRASVSDPWKPTGRHEFRIMSATILESGGAFASPVANAYGDSLAYLLTDGPVAPPVLYESTWSIPMNAWAVGIPPGNPEFANTMATPVRRPTGVSPDQLTLFFFDEIAGKERAAWRTTRKAPYDKFVDLPMLPEAAPAGDCLSIYFHGSDMSGQGLFVGTGP
jgi:hypothetical protein